VTYGGRKRRTTHESDPGASLWVYGRNGEPCRRCGEAIRRRIQGMDARVTFWCPRCQPMPDGTAASSSDGLSVHAVLDDLVAESGNRLAQPKNLLQSGHLALDRRGWSHVDRCGAVPVRRNAAS
jgi:hypothetical protein